MKKLLSALLLLAAFDIAHAAPPPAAAREIERLITTLGASGCDFERNGSWYPAKQAEDHLRSKYEWLRKRDLVATPEQFIERAGTKSSISGRAYHVRCPGRPSVESAAWLRARLIEMRHHAPTRDDAR